MTRRTLYFLAATLLLLGNLSFGQTYTKNDFSVYKWQIRDWKKSFYIDLPKKNFKCMVYWSGTAKSIHFYYTDSSSIHIMVDPPSFDSTDRNFIFAKSAIKQETDLTCIIDSEMTDTIVKHDTTIFQGQLSNGKFWKEQSYKRVKICYINICKDQISLYDKSIDTFRNRRRK